VSTLARIFTEAFTKPGYNMEDFLDHTYDTLLDTEFKKKIKQEPALSIEWKDDFLLFPESKHAAGDEEMQVELSDPITELWSFGS